MKKLKKVKERNIAEKQFQLFRKNDSWVPW